MEVGPKGDDEYTGDSIRPKLEEDDSVAEDWETDEDEDLSCGVCGVGDGEEEAEDSEDDGVSPFKEERRVAENGDDEVRRVKAIKDERTIKEVVDPRRPTEKEVDEHNMHHLPYRNWCNICAQAKGKDTDHRKSTQEERGLSEYSFDYCFPGDELGCKLTVLVGKERVTGMYSGTAVPMKGSMGQFVIDKVMEVIDEVGDAGQQIITKTDQEPSIVTLVEDIVKAREDGRTLVEQSPVQSSGSNGVVERAAQGIEGQIRVVLIALEGKVERQLDPQEAVVTFIPEYAAYVLNRLEVGKDGKTAYERAKGKKATVVGIEFGEKVLWR